MSEYVKTWHNCTTFYNLHVSDLISCKPNCIAWYNIIYKQIIKSHMTNYDYVSLTSITYEEKNAIFLYI